MISKIKFLATATLAASAALVSAASHAELRLDGVVSKIELVQDANDYFGTRVTVYDPVNAIGAATTTSVNFFDRTNGVGFNLRKPDNGVYETAIVHFASLDVSGSQVPGGVTADLLAAQVVAGNMFSHEGATVLVMGDIDSGAGSVDADVMGGAGTGQINTQPIVVTSSGYSFPTLNLGMPASNAVETATGVTILNVAAPQAISRNVDSADVGNVTVQVQSSVFHGAADFVSGTSHITVGLFETDLPAKPLAYSTFRSSTAASDTTLTDVTFYDVAEGATYVPVAWFDADNDKELDAGELVTTSEAAVANAQFTMPGTADVDYVDHYVAAGDGELDEAVAAMPARKFDLQLAIRDGSVAANLTNNVAAASSTIISTAFDDGTGNQTETPGNITAELQFDLGTGILALPITLGSDSAGADNGLIEDTETIYPIIADGSDLGVTGPVSYDATNELLTISGIPATVTNFTAAGTYSIDINIDEVGGTVNGAFTTNNGAPVTLNYTQADTAISAAGVVAPANGSINVTPLTAD